MIALLPPADIYAREPALVRLKAGQVVHRFYTAAYDPIHFDRSTLGRFNAPDGGYGTFYVAEDAAGAFAETFLRQPGRSLIDTDFLARKAHVRLELLADLTLAQLSGPGLAILGATAQVCHSGLPYDMPQAWSQALFDHPLAVDGIAYRARHDDDRICYAVFERDGTTAAFREVERRTDLDADWFWELAETYNLGLAP